MFSAYRFVIMPCVLAAGMIALAAVPHAVAGAKHGATHTHKSELNTDHKHDHEVELRHGEISVIEINAKVGEIVKIIYDDHDGVHKLYAKEGNYEFDLSHMKRGDHYDLKLDHAGTIWVRCHEMDHMTLVINVTE
ncbi:MAG: hypothetical protein AAF346_06240 [Pseudomonadota bacterium]